MFRFHEKMLKQAQEQPTRKRKSLDPCASLFASLLVLCAKAIFTMKSELLLLRFWNSGFIGISCIAVHSFKVLLKIWTWYVEQFQVNDCLKCSDLMEYSVFTTSSSNLWNVRTAMLFQFCKCVVIFNPARFIPSRYMQPSLPKPAAKSWKGN